MLPQSTSCLQFPDPSDDEQWLPVVGFEGLYEVSSFGRVRSLDRRASDGRRLPGKLRALVPSTNGYLMLFLSKGGGKVNRTVHSLVAEAFIGPCPAGCEVNHISGQKHNNRAVELEYVTSSANHVHAIRAGLQPVRRGTQSRTCALSEAQVRNIRLEYPATTTRILAKKYGVGKSTIQAITSGNAWKHLV